MYMCSIKKTRSLPLVTFCGNHRSFIGDLPILIECSGEVLIQYSQRPSVINHCDRRITLLSDTDISFGLFNLFTYSDMPFG